MKRLVFRYFTAYFAFAIEIFLTSGCVEVNSGQYYEPSGATQLWECQHKVRFERCSISKEGVQIDVFVNDTTDSTWYGLGVPMFPGKSADKTQNTTGTFLLEVHIIAPQQGMHFDPTKTILIIPQKYSIQPANVQLIWASSNKNITTISDQNTLLPGKEQRNYKLEYALSSRPAIFSIQLNATHVNGTSYNLPMLTMHMTSGSHYDLVSPGP